MVLIPDRPVVVDGCMLNKRGFGKEPVHQRTVLTPANSAMSWRSCHLQFQLFWFSTEAEGSLWFSCFAAFISAVSLVFRLMEHLPLPSHLAAHQACLHKEEKARD